MPTSDDETSKDKVAMVGRLIKEMEENSRAISYHLNQAIEHLKKAEAYRVQAKIRFGVEIPELSASN